MAPVFHEESVRNFVVQTPASSNVLQSKNQLSVQDIANSLQLPPPVLSQNYFLSCVRAAAVVGNPISSNVAAQGFDQSGVALINQAHAGRANVLDQISNVSSFISQAAAAGFGTPDNPFSAIANMNAHRVGYTPVLVDQATADKLMNDVNTFVTLLTEQKSGQIDFSDQTASAPQLSSAEISLDGFGGSGNTMTDLMRFLPDLDLVQQAKAQAALSVLDFSKRVPHMLFTLDYAPDGPVKGSIIGWKKIPDASGYVLSRHSVFKNKDVSYTLTNDDLNSRFPHIKDYVNAFGLSFYDNVNLDNVFAYLDVDVDPHQYYNYELKAYQVQLPLKGTIFSRSTVAAHFDTSLLTVPGSNPYPLLSAIILGDEQYDWILAALNIRSSIDRKDDRTTTRKYSYINSTFDFLKQQMTNNLFVQPVPGDLNKIVQDVSKNISTYGVSQTIQELLSDTGIFYFFEQKEPQDEPYFSRIGATDPSQSDLMSAIAAAIDPETASIDLRAMATNLTTLLNGQGTDSASGTPLTQASPEEIEVPNPTNINVPSEVQFLQQLGNMDFQHTDLTTFAGLSQFIRAIRIVANAGPNRGIPLTSLGAAGLQPGTSLVSIPGLLTLGTAQGNLRPTAPVISGSGQ